MKTVPFFMRFYGRTDEEIFQCLEELKQNGLPEYVRHKIADADMSVNFSVPEEYQPAREVTLYFKDMKDATVMHNNSQLQDIYHKWATKTPNDTTFELRKPKDMAWAI